DASDHVSQKGWLSARYESPGLRTFTTANTLGAPCMKRLPRFRVLQTCCCFAATLRITDFLRKLRHSSPTFALLRKSQCSPCWVITTLNRDKRNWFARFLMMRASTCLTAKPSKSRESALPVFLALGAVSAGEC